MRFSFVSAPFYAENIILVFESFHKYTCTRRAPHAVTLHKNNLGLYSLSGKTSYRRISWSLEAARFGFKLFQSQHPISRLRDFTRFGGKTSYRLVNRGPGSYSLCLSHYISSSLNTRWWPRYLWDNMFTLLCIDDGFLFITNGYRSSSCRNKVKMNKWPCNIHNYR